MQCDPTTLVHDELRGVLSWLASTGGMLVFEKPTSCGTGEVHAYRGGVRRSATWLVSNPQETPLDAIVAAVNEVKREHDRQAAK
jgi:hypothetical protein